MPRLRQRRDRRDEKGRRVVRVRHGEPAAAAQEGRAVVVPCGTHVVLDQQPAADLKGLRIEGNDASLAPNAPTNPAFVANMSGEQLAVGANRLGAGIRLYEVR